MHNRLYQPNMCIKFPINQIKIDRVITLRLGREKWLEKWCKKNRKFTYSKKNSKKNSKKDKLKTLEMHKRLYQPNMCIKFPINRIKIDRVIALRWGPEKWREKWCEKRCREKSLIRKKILKKNLRKIN